MPLRKALATCRARELRVSREREMRACRCGWRQASGAPEPTRLHRELAVRLPPCPPGVAVARHAESLLKFHGFHSPRRGRLPLSTSLPRRVNASPAGWVGGILRCQNLHTPCRLPVGWAAGVPSLPRLVNASASPAGWEGGVVPLTLRESSHPAWQPLFQVRLPASWAAGVRGGAPRVQDGRGHQRGGATRTRSPSLPPSLPPGS